MTKLKDKEKILKAIRENQVITYKGAPIRLASDFSNISGQKGMVWNIQDDKKQESTTKATLPSKTII